MGGWGFFGFLMLLGLVLLVAVVVWAMGGGIRRGDPDGPSPSGGGAQSQARLLLDEWYARGELTTEEYQERLRALGNRD